MIRMRSPSLAPYAVMSAVYTYAPGSYAQIGFTESQNATDVIAPDAKGRITQYQQSSTLYASINHKLTSKLLGTVIGRWQHSVYQRGPLQQSGDWITIVWVWTCRIVLPRIFRVMLAIILMMFTLKSRGTVTRATVFIWESQPAY